MSSHRPELALSLATKSSASNVVLITYNYTMARDENLQKAIEQAAKSGIDISWIVRDQPVRELIG